MSKQSGSFEQDEVKSKKVGGRHRRRGPWEVWVIKTYRFGRTKEWVWKYRDYATEDLAQVVQDKLVREGYYDTVEIRYNEKKA